MLFGIFHVLGTGALVTMIQVGIKTKVLERLDGFSLFQNNFKQKNKNF